MVTVGDVHEAYVLQGVAHKVGLLVTPDSFGSHYQDGDPEDEEDGQPDLAKAGGVAINSNQLGVQCTPAHSGASAGLDLLGRNKRHILSIIQTTILV
uniref:Uncharacterized protein n=1 Tax=Astyanax mexicanus TaxID=7994 RepID=A0A3B1IYI9_ASTMX